MINALVFHSPFSVLGSPFLIFQVTFSIGRARVSLRRPQLSQDVQRADHANQRASLVHHE